MAQMYRGLQTACARIREPKQRVIRYGPFQKGLVTSRPPQTLREGECYEFQNILIDPDGMPRTRPGLSEAGIGTAASVTINQIGDVKVDGVWRKIISCSEGSSHMLFYEDATHTTETAIGSSAHFDGKISFVGFNDLLIIFDGGYSKYWDGTDLLLLEDLGTGVKATYLLQNLDGDLDTVDPTIYYHSGLVNDALAGKYSKLAVPFTTPTINANFDVPVIDFSVRMARVGAGTNTAGTFIQAAIRTSADVLVVQKSLVLPESLPQLTATAGKDVDTADYETVKGSFSTSEAGLASNTQYYLSFEFSNGSEASGNYPVIVYNVENDSTTAYFHAYDNSTSAWLTSNGSCLTLDISCGTPPVLTYGIVHESRLFAYDAENPSKLWYSGAGNHLDWSSPNSGGFLSTGREIGGIASFYESVWIFGTEQTPALMRLTGGEPQEYALSDSIQSVASYQATIATAPDDIIFLHPTGLSTINTMQAYGDVRANTRSDNIKNIILSEYDENAFGGYEPKSGLYMLKLNDGMAQTVYIFHTKRKEGGRFPVSKWVFTLPNISGVQTISCISSGRNAFYIGTNKGLTYELDYDVINDVAVATPPTYIIKSRYFLARFNDMTAYQFSAGMMSEGGATCSLKFYRDLSRTSFFSKTLTVQSDYTGLDPDVNSTYLEAFMRGRLNFNFEALMVSYEDVVPDADTPVYFHDIEILAG